MAPINHQTGRVAYVADPKLLACADAVPCISRRASMVHSLISAYKLCDKMIVVPSVTATEEDIRLFHSEDYVEFLKTAKPTEDDEESENVFGLGFDCPVLPNLWTIVTQMAGASITAAKLLTAGKATVAINWCGGWHHAQRDSASGFCYINDIVLAIHQLLTKFPKILYIDIDAHHGDGVENAFLFSPKVVTFSMHQHETGFFPGTGELEDVGSGRGRYHAVNVPYRTGVNDQQFIYLFESIIYDLCEVFNPDAVVCQCGADTLVSDPIAGGNVTIEGVRGCVRQVLHLNKPTLFLGGGGYNVANTAKLWTALTATILNTSISSDIPEHMYFPMYGPSFELEITPGMKKSENNQESLDTIIQTVYENLDHLAGQLGKDAIQRT